MPAAALVLALRALAVLVGSASEDVLRAVVRRSSPTAAGERGRREQERRRGSWLPVERPQLDSRRPRMTPTRQTSSRVRGVQQPFLAAAAASPCGLREQAEHQTEQQPCRRALDSQPRNISSRRQHSIHRPGMCPDGGAGQAPVRPCTQHTVQGRARLISHYPQLPQKVMQAYPEPWPRARPKQQPKLEIGQVQWLISQSIILQRLRAVSSP